jgi:hypothetical protein
MPVIVIVMGVHIDKTWCDNRALSIHHFDALPGTLTNFDDDSVIYSHIG